jgi:hypothetical protein
MFACLNVHKSMLLWHRQSGTRHFSSFPFILCSLCLVRHVKRFVESITICASSKVPLPPYMQVEHSARTISRGSGEEEGRCVLREDRKRKGRGKSSAEVAEHKSEIHTQLAALSYLPTRLEALFLQETFVGGAVLELGTTTASYLYSSSTYVRVSSSECREFVALLGSKYRYSSIWRLTCCKKTYVPSHENCSIRFQFLSHKYCSVNS